MAENILKTIQDIVLATDGVAGIAFPGVIPKPKRKALDFDVHINVEYNVNIPDTAWNIQENIKHCKALSDVKTDRINIFVEGIDFKENEKE